ncbi:MAG: PQQ-dependent sugar dehydrogenase [Planctomycetaceae bacterium]|nr:PQQ-dependent sugar dehydrogenase [Planctomycetaceae bacterium]
MTGTTATLLLLLPIINAAAEQDDGLPAERVVSGRPLSEDATIPALDNTTVRMQNAKATFDMGQAGANRGHSWAPQRFRHWESPRRSVSRSSADQNGSHISPREYVTVGSRTGSHQDENLPDARNLEELEAFALTHKGDAKSGATLFADKRTKCSVCHRIGKTGGAVGPDLTNIGNKYDRPHLIDALLYPSRQIGYGYETTTILTRSGRTISGIAKGGDESHVKLLDAENRITRVAKADIEESIVSRTSLMPTGLASSLSRSEFVDLITYLESLGRGAGRLGSGVSGPLQLADGFRLTTVATGLSGAVALDVATDGRVFICEQDGRLRVVQDDKLLPAPFVSLPVECNWERGLIGVTLAPDFPTNPYVYVVYVADKPYTHHRISRFRAMHNAAVPGSEEILFRGDDQSRFGGSRPAGHQGGGIHFGPDGKLYIGLGEQTAKPIAQRMDALQGKILRLNADGTIPADNPLLHETTGKYQAIWAVGCRNPFTFAFSESGELLINDVGGRFEEINRGSPGANYGWPTVDHGPTDHDGITGPVHTYPQSSINGGDFCRADSNWPTRLHGKYFFADFVKGWVKYIDPNSPGKAHDFLAGIRRPVDLRFAPDGSLYVLQRNAWVVDNRFQGGTGALVRISRQTRKPNE